MNYTALLNFFAALLAIVNPIGNVAIFLQYAASEPPKVQRRIGFFVGLTVLLLLTLFFLTGTWLLDFFGISIASFRIAGGILLLLTGISMIRRRRQRPDDDGDHPDLSTGEAARAGFKRLFVPVAVPLFVGPGSITTVILYAHQADGVLQWTMLGVIAAVAAIVAAVLMLGHYVRKLLGELGLSVAIRLFGLVLSAIGVQFILAGLHEATINFINPGVLH